MVYRRSRPRALGLGTCQKTNTGFSAPDAAWRGNIALQSTIWFVFQCRRFSESFLKQTFIQSFGQKPTYRSAFSDHMRYLERWPVVRKAQYLFIQSLLNIDAVIAVCIVRFIRLPLIIVGCTIRHAFLYKRVEQSSLAE